MRVLWEDAAVILDNQDLVIGDLHIGLEVTMRRHGYRLIPVYRQIISKVLDLIDRHNPKRLVLLGDIKDSIGNPTSTELSQLEEFVSSVDIPILAILGNHDGGLKHFLESKGINTYPASGFLDGSVYLFHGNAYPSNDARGAEMLVGCHWHPMIEINDNGVLYRDRAWILAPTSFGPNIIMVPSFNNLVGGATPDQITEKYVDMDHAEIYLMDGTFLGVWGQIKNKLK